MSALVDRLRHRADEMQSGYIRPNWVSDRKLLREAADMIESLCREIVEDESLMLAAASTIESMNQRIEADDAAYKELERRHAD